MGIGDEIEVKGPIGHVSYFGRGKFTIHKNVEMLNHVGLIAGGTGITPAYQIIKAVVKDKKDNTKVYLLYANKTEEDILLKDELDELARKYPKSSSFTTPWTSLPRVGSTHRASSTKK